MRVVAKAYASMKVETDSSGVRWRECLALREGQWTLSSVHVGNGSKRWQRDVSIDEAQVWILENNIMTIPEQSDP